jgi:FKBP-type peptidyl-prolyl cis-trans isomerase FklB
MKLIFIGLFCLGLVSNPLQSAESVTNKTKAVASDTNSILKDKKARISYAMGMDIGADIKRAMADIDPEIFLKGFKATYLGQKALLTDEEVHHLKDSFEKDFEAKMAKMQQEEIEKAKKEGEDFLAANKKKEGVVTLPSGLQYKILKEGSGAKPTKESTVLIHYIGTFVDGSEFDNSYKREIPNTVPLNVVIKGWSEALQLMKVGSKWRLFVPSHLAYGARGADHARGRKILPYATVIYDMELVSIKN